MKNNIGRKLTSLTLMTIMFAGGMTAAVPSMMPGIFADGGTSSADGIVSLSSSKIQGASILEIVIDDPSISALDTAIAVPTVTFIGGATTTLTSYQATDGKWYAYIVDDAQSTTADALSALNFGIDCTGAAEATTLKDGAGNTLNVSGSALDFWWLGGDHDCSDPDGPDHANNSLGISADGAGSSNVGAISSNSPDEVLIDPPTPNRNSSANNGQIYAVQNTTSGNNNGLWPFIHQVTMASDNVVKYNNVEVPFEWGNMNSDAEIAFSPDVYANGADINLIITDNGLNIDPTVQDKWKFGAAATVGSETTARVFANGTDGSDIDGSLNTIGFANAKNLTATGDTGSFCVAATIEETGDSTGVFTTPDANGASDCDTSATATNHHSATYSWAGESTSIHIAYSDATISMDAGDAWMPAEAAVVTIVDADANRVNGYDETMGMTVLNAATTIPYITTGSPIYLGVDTTGQSTPQVKVVDKAATTGYPPQSVAASGGSEKGIYELTTVAATTAATTHTVNIGTDYSTASVGNLTGTVVLQYDIASIFDTLSATSMTLDTMGNTSTGGPAAASAFAANYTGLNSGQGV